MKKFSLSISLAMLASALALSSTIANAQATPAPAQDEKQAEFERNWYEICYQKKDNEKCCMLSKELIEKYSTSTYLKNATANVKNCETGKAGDKFQAALKAFYSGQPDATKLEQLVTAGEDFLKIQNDQPFVVAQLALAGANGVLGQYYKNLDKVKGYAERALKLFESSTPPKDWKPDEWAALREAVLAQMNQFMGYYLIETKGDQEQALSYLTKATQVKGKDGAGWKDPNNYWLRSSIYSKQYEQVRSEYDKLPDDQKTGEAGKALLTKVNEIVDKMIPEYARVQGTATKPEAKPLQENAKQLFDSFWKFRTDDPSKAQAYIKAFEADPTVAGPPIPVKADTSGNLSAPAAPTTGTSSPKLSVGSTATPPGGAKNGSSSKASTTKKSNSKTTKSKRGRKG